MVRFTCHVLCIMIIFLYNFSHEMNYKITVSLCSKWKGDKLSVHSLQVSPKGDCLLSAGRDIRLWDLETKEILQVCLMIVFPVCYIK